MTTESQPTPALPTERQPAPTAKTDKPRTLVIWNPGAGGGGEGPEGRRAIERALDAHGVRVELFESPSEEATEERVDRAVSEGVERIVAAGGDHTVRSVAFHLIDTGVALGILPLGTAMNVARSLDIPIELDAAAGVLSTGSVRSVDVGYVGDQPFLEVATVGLAASLLGDATEVSRGRVRSVIDFIVRAVRHRRTRVWLQLDGREARHRVVSLAIANGPYTGRALEAVPGAAIDDGLLDVVCYLGYGPLEFLREVVRLLTGVGSGARIARYRARRVNLRSHHPLLVRADSTDITTTPVQILARPRSLRVTTP